MFGLGKKKEPEIAEPELTIERAKNEMGLRTQGNIEVWGQDEASWSVDLDEGWIEFLNQKGQRITAPVQVVGTYNTKNGTWLWGWDHPSVPEPCAKDAKLAREFGERYGLEEYTTRKIECDESLCWEFAAVACHLAGAQGAYRGPSGPANVFMTFGTVTIAKA